MGNIIKDKTYLFSIEIVKLCRDIERVKKEHDISRQLKRSGTAPGALVRESEFAESKKDFVHKLHIALKEANETEYWLDILKAGDYIDKLLHEKLKDDCSQII